jgi:hypothetical protein
MSKRVKVKEHENLTPSNIRKVMSLLSPTEESAKPISKKEACEILNISYNTTRLEKIIEGFLEQETYVKRRREQKRGTAATKDEIKEIVSDYLSGVSISKIATSQYRSIAFIKNIIDTIGVPERPTSAEDKRGTALLPDACVKESFEPEELVWCAMHHLPGRIKYELSIDYQAEKAGFIDTNYEKKYGSKCYTVWVITPASGESSMFHSGGFYASFLAYDLGSLSHLKEYGISIV